MLRTFFTSALLALAPVGAARAAAIEITVGTAQTFAVRGKPLVPGRPRRGPIGRAAPGPGEVTVGLAPAGYAVGVAKLHVYESTRVPVGFRATAMRGDRRLATRMVCGRLGMDAWVTFPAGTRTARLADFAVAERGCR